MASVPPVSEAQPPFAAFTIPLQRRWQVASQYPYRLFLAASAAAAVVIAWLLHAPGLAITVLALTDAGLAVWLWRAGRPLRLIGPLLIYDLARLARRGRTTLLRSLYAALVLGWLCAMAMARFPDVTLAGFFGKSPAMPIDEWAEFARKFVISLLSLQAAAVLAFTPPYLGGALAEEKDRRTLDLLFTSDLVDRELVLGKLLGRMLHLGIILMAALPIFALARLWGGIDDDMLTAGLTVAVMSLLSTGAISMLCSVACRSTLQAVVASYLIVFSLNVCCLAAPMTSPVMFVSAWDAAVAAEWKEYLDQFKFIGGVAATPAFPPPNPTITLRWMLVPFVLIHALIFLGCTIASIKALRPSCLAPGEVVFAGVLPKDRVVLSSGTLQLPALEARWQPVIAAYSPQPVTEPALLWKEMIHGTATVPGPGPVAWLVRARRSIVFRVGCVITASLLLCWSFPGQWPAFLELVNPLLRAATVGLMGLWCLLLAFRAAGCISRERDAGTLDGLLTLPGSRDNIIRAKWQGSILRYRHLGYALVGIAAWGLAIGAFHPWAVLLLIATCAVHLAFLASAGLWLSLVSRNTLWANMSMATLLLFWSGFVSVATIGEFLGDFNRGSVAYHFASLFLAPAPTWWFTAFSWGDVVSAVVHGEAAFWGKLLGATVSVPIFGAAAWVFWRLARDEFRSRKSWQRR